MRRFFTFLFFVVYSAGFSQSLNTKKLDSLLSAISDHHLGMGSLAISKNGKVIYQRAFGSASLAEGGNVAATPATKYRIGSISKMFTAVLVFQLIEEGKLQLTTTLDQFFPELPQAKVITIRDLLYHRSGLHDYTKDSGFETWLDQPKTHEELLSFISSMGPDFTPDEKASYCNSNFLVLSYIAEKITGKSYAQLLTDRITSKQGLKNTYYGNGTDIRKGESTSYKYAAGKWVKDTETNLDLHSGAGAIVSTPADLTRFAEALFAGKLISRKSVDAMKTLVDYYGMGMFAFPFMQRTAFGHGGRIDGFSSTLQYFPEERLAIAYCTNGIVYPKEDVVEAILRICFNEPYVIPQFNSTTALSQQTLDGYTGTYSSVDLPIKIICTSLKGALTVETQGQPFATQWIGKDQFMNAQFGFFFVFRPGELTLKEGDNVYVLKKE